MTHMYIGALRRRNKRPIYGTCAPTKIGLFTCKQSTLSTSTALLWLESSQKRLVYANILPVLSPLLQIFVLIKGNIQKRSSDVVSSMQRCLSASSAFSYLHRLYARLQALQSVVKVESLLQNSLELFTISLILALIPGEGRELFYGQKQL
jgi:hypothetical protein